MSKCIYIGGDLKKTQEAYDLLVQAGYRAYDVTGVNFWVGTNAQYLVVDFCKNYIDWTDSDNDDEEITLPQLKDLVVLKRNDVGDATHIDTKNNMKYRIMNGDWYFYSHVHGWRKSQNSEKEMESVVLIEPKMSILDTGRLEMKEYLVKSASDGSYSLVTACASSVADGVDAIEVPVGANIAALGSKSGKLVFYKDGGESQFDTGSWYECGMVINGIEHKNINYFLAFDVKNKVVWQRHTQPEEIPFIDEPSLHVQYETPENKAKIVNAIESAYAAKSLNNQYAEIEKVRQANNETEFLMQGANGERLKASIEEFKNTDHGVAFNGFNLLPEFEFSKPIELKPVESDGGSSGYYFTKLPQHIIDQIVKTGGVEIKDIARYVYDNNADAFNIIKAQKRIIEAKKGGGKKGASMQYDANKIVYFGNEQLNALIADQ